MHLHVPRLPLPAVLLSLLYAAAVAVALTHSGAHTLAGLVVLAGVVARWVVRARRSPASADVVVLAAEPAVVPPAAA